MEPITESRADMNLSLQRYQTETSTAISFIKAFWLEHSQEHQSDEEAQNDLNAWTNSRSAFYFIVKDQKKVGFIHLGSRGGSIDWLEHLFVLPQYRRQGIGSYAVREAEQLVKGNSESMYIEVAARSQNALLLYHSLGYDVLNTITVRKDFQPEHFQTVGEETLYDHTFIIRKRK